MNISRVSTKTNQKSTDDGRSAQRSLSLPRQTGTTCSGLPSSIDREITADFIRNICYRLLHPDRATDAVPEEEIAMRQKEIIFFHPDLY